MQLETQKQAFLFFAFSKCFISTDFTALHCEEYLNKHTAQKKREAREK